MPTSRGRALALVVLGLALVALRATATGSLGTPVARPGLTADAAARETAAAAAFRRGEPIDVNTASAEDLALLPHVGPALALRIVAERTAHGPFGAVGDLRRVPGVGPRTLAHIERLLTTNAAQRSNTSP